jgi:Ni/Fe-hydrogenase 1 B-type cytochrome subunit
MEAAIQESKPHVRHLRRVYVWQLPVRIYHWLNASAIIVLVITGLYMGSPLALQSHKEAAETFNMGYVRMIHFIAAYIFLFNFIFRIYWGFVGNKYADWRNFIPTSKKYWREILHVLKIDILLLKGKEHMSVGHNALAGITYFLTFIAFLVQCLTGFGLYAGMSTWWFPKLFAWVPALFGGDIVTREIHHWATWFFVLFTIVHVYLVFYHDYVEGRGEISSMGGGWKFIEEEVFDAHKSEKATAPEIKK